MAGVGDSVVVSRGGLEDDLLGLGKDERSLQELIDSELALRIGRVDGTEDESENITNATLDFLEAESRHASLCLDQTNSNNPLDADVDNDWTTVEEVVSRMTNPAAKHEINNEINCNDVSFSDESNSLTSTNTVCLNNNYNNVSIIESFTTKKSSEIIGETKTIITTTTTKTIMGDEVSHSESNCTEEVVVSNHDSSSAQISTYHIDETNSITTNHSETLETESLDQTEHLQTNDNDSYDELDQAPQCLENSLTDEHDVMSLETNNSISTEDMKENAEKKSKKKKTAVQNGESVTTKSKKKKSKKSDEKENHISVVLNGHEHNDNDIGPLSPSSCGIDDNELMNVSVKNLTQSYVSEASKCFYTGSKSSEQPVPPSVPIRELRRSFGDIHKACEIAELSYDMDDKQLKSSFSKFDQLSKKTVLHVRSSDPAKAQKTFSQGGDGENPVCKACGKTAFVMEQIKAERAVWHKNCFRCNTCKKQLTIDIYSSHEGELYCKPHFRELFTPKAVVETEEPASDKPDLGLEELSSLNVKSKFQVFERGESNQEEDRGPTKVDVKRSPSILSKLARFQKRGMDVGVTDEDLDGYVYEESSSEEEQDEEEDNEEGGVIKCRKVREKPMSFGKMNDVKKNWESGATRKEEMLEQKKQDLQHLRSRLFMGKQVQMKEMYEQAVAESECKLARKESDVVRSEKAKVFREQFEKGEIVGKDEETDKNKAVNEDLSIFEEGISKKSRSIFLEMDAKTQSNPVPAQVSIPKEPKKPARDSDSPDREVYRDPTVVRSEDKVEEDEAVKRSQTASKMLSIFRQMEEARPTVPDGPKPKKEFTPPPDYRGVSSSEDESEEESEEEEESDEEINDDGVIKSSHKIKDEFLEGNKSAARAKDLAAKFESWEPERQSANNAVAMLDSEQPSLESTKSLRAHFESLKNQKNEQESKSRPRVNRFVETATTVCSSCENKVYPLERIETDGKIFHKNCFRCSYCNCILRMDSYTLNASHLYCLPHFKQLFISKGNYDEGFGVDQHKRKWEVNGTVA